MKDYIKLTNIVEYTAIKHKGEYANIDKMINCMKDQAITLNCKIKLFYKDQEYFFDEFGNFAKMK